MGKIRNGAWIQTYTGKQFWPMDARPEEVDIQDIAHALSMLCRFNGHCNRFYSVAEHSVHVSNTVKPKQALWGLLHDAAEAYLSDLPQPIKRQMPDFGLFEDLLLEVIADRFGLSSPIPPEVKHADAVMLATEKSALMGAEPAPWGEILEPLDPEMIHGWEPEKAKQKFLERFEELL